MVKNPVSENDAHNPERLSSTGYLFTVKLPRWGYQGERSESSMKLLNLCKAQAAVRPWQVVRAPAKPSMIPPSPPK